MNNDDRYAYVLKKLRSLCNFHSEGSYDPIFEFVLLSHPDLRSMIQFWCIEKFKYEECERLGYNINRNQAALLWIDRGYAKRFADVYNLDLDPDVIYANTISSQ